jgi:enolase
MSVMQALHAREILDSRGIPTVLATCRLQGGAEAAASVPSGRSTGAAEALELRDGDNSRYRGLGCLKAAANVNGEIARRLVGRDLPSQAACDNELVALDGTANKSRLGANALLAVSVAFARAQAGEAGMPLYDHFAGMLDPRDRAAGGAQLPRLTINLFSGGLHAGRQVAIQDVLVVPLSPSSIDASLVMMHDIYHAAADAALAEHGMRALVADEGGLAPSFTSTEQMIEAAVGAIRAAGFLPGKDAALALDIASSHFFQGGSYRIDDRNLSAAQMVELLASWVDRYPILSVEDGLAEDDWESWPLLEKAVGGRALVLGDDLLCTNPQRIERAVRAHACNALLLKVNQVGTLTEAAHALHLARSAGWQVTVSVRSGETEDTWAADLAVGWRGDQFKNGSIQRSERLAKYNRLLAIEAETGWPVRPWSPRRP